MGLSNFPPFVPANVLEWGKFFRDVKVTASNDTIEDEQFTDRSALSVMGVAGNAEDKPADIVATSNDRFFGRRADALGFFALADADIPSGIARDTEVAAAVTAHEALPDPHPGYTTAAELTAALASYALASKLPTVLGDYANDAAAAGGGVAVGSMYHTSGAVKIRLA